jgi:hypothetical protein
MPPSFIFYNYASKGFSFQWHDSIHNRRKEWMSLTTSMHCLFSYHIGMETRPCSVWSMEVNNLIPFFVSLKTRNTKQFFCFAKLISNTSHFFIMIIIIIVYFSLHMNAIL